MKTIRNDRSGETINSPHSDAEAAKLFAEAFGEKDSWLWFWIHKAIINRRPADTATAKSLRLIGDMFIVALGYGLKRPMLRLHFRNQRFKVYLSTRGTVCLKSGMLRTNYECGCGGLCDRGGDYCPMARHIPTHEPVGNEFYVGCLLRGQFLPQRDDNTGRVRSLSGTEQEFLEQLTSRPAEFIAECGRDMDRCGYCNQPLEDERSKRVGYGATCAKHWGLPWGDSEYLEKAPSFVKSYDTVAQGLLGGIREYPEDAQRWLVFADWLEEHGLPRCKAPERAVVVPRE